MNEREEIRIVEEMQRVVEQMKIDDVSENPDSLNEVFTCSCCGDEKVFAGSVMYDDGVVLCNDCVLLAEVGFVLGKIKTVGDLIKSMEEKRLEKMCNFIAKNQKKNEN